MTRTSENNSKPNSTLENTAYAFLATTVAAFALLKKNNYKLVLHLYKNTGGGGLKLCKDIPGEKLERKVALDFHPLFNKKTNTNEWCLHYHAGKDKTEINQHKVICFESDIKNLFK